MTITSAATASTVLLTATVMSAGYQAYRAAVGTYPSVDSFDMGTVVSYVVLAGIALAIRVDRRWTWWATAILMTLLLAYGVVGYYPKVWAVRPMDRLDWLEGTLFTGGLILVLSLSLLRLTGTVLATGGTIPAADRADVTR
jgi:hypothetical protein